MNMKTHTHTLLAFVAASALVLGALFQTGCASTGERPDITRADIVTAAEIAAGLAIGDRHQLALQYVRDAREFLGSGENTTVDAVVDHLLNRALHDQLEPGQAIAVKRFIDRFRDNFALEVEQVGIANDTLITVSEVLDAVERVALEIQRYGAPVPRTYARPTAAAPRESIPPMRRRQDLIGHIFNLQEPNPAWLDKWGPGLRTAVQLAE